MFSMRLRKRASCACREESKFRDLFALFYGVVGVIATADERAGFDVAEAEMFAVALEFGEFLEGNIANDGKVLEAGAEVLAEGEDVDEVFSQQGHGMAHFLEAFAEAEHEAALGGDFRVTELGMAEHIEAALKAGAEADLFVEAGHGFGVVIEDVGAGIEDDVHRRMGALKIGNEDFDAAAGNAVADGVDGGGKQGGPAVGLVIAIDAGDDGEAEAHAGDGFGDAVGFVVIDGERGALLDGAEAAAAGAEVAEDHEGGGAAVPAVADVGTGGAFADGVQFEVGDELFEVTVVFADGGGGFEPIGAFGLGRFNTD